jgi:hypothetical protein
MIVHRDLCKYVTRTLGAGGAEYNNGTWHIGDLVSNRASYGCGMVLGAANFAAIKYVSRGIRC